MGSAWQTSTHHTYTAQCPLHVLGLSYRIRTRYSKKYLLWRNAPLTCSVDEKLDKGPIMYSVFAMNKLCFFRRTVVYVHFIGSLLQCHTTPTIPNKLPNGMAVARSNVATLTTTNTDPSFALLDPPSIKGTYSHIQMLVSIKSVVTGS